MRWRFFLRVALLTMATRSARVDWRLTPAATLSLSFFKDATNMSQYLIAISAGRGLRESPTGALLLASLALSWIALGKASNLSTAPMASTLPSSSSASSSALRFPLTLPLTLGVMTLANLFWKLGEFKMLEAAFSTSTLVLRPLALQYFSISPGSSLLV